MANDKAIPELDKARPGAPAADFSVPVWDEKLQKTVQRSLGATLGIGSSDIRGGVKFVRFLSSSYFGVAATDSTLDRVDEETLVVGNAAVVQNPSTTPTTSTQQARGFVLARVAVGTAGAVLAYIDDAEATTLRYPCQWVEAGTAAGNAATIEPFDENRDIYPNDSTIKFVLGGVLSIFSSKRLLRKTDFSTGKIPAPTGLLSDSNWSAVPSNNLAHAQNTDLGTTARLFTLGLGPNLTPVPGSGKRTVLAFAGGDGDKPAALAYHFRDDNGDPVAEFQTCASYTGDESVDVWKALGGGDDLLKTENTFKEVNTFEKGIKLPVGALVDDSGRLFAQKVDVGQRHFIAGNNYSLGQYSAFVWKPDEFVNQDGDGDVGISRSGPGVLEINDGRPNYLATLRAFDVLGFGAPFEYNSIIKLGNAMQNVAHVAGARVLWIEGGLQSYSPRRGVRSRPFPDLPSAQLAALDGDTLVVRRGGTGRDVYGRPYYTESFLWESNTRIIFEPGAVYGGLFQLAAFNSFAAFTKRTIIGGEFLGRVLLWRQSSADVDVLLIGVRFTGIGFFEVNGAGSYNNSFLTKAVLRDCRFESSLGVNDRAPVQLIGRDDMGPVAIELDNTLVISPAAPTLTFQANEASRLTLLGTTELRGPNKVQNLPTSPSAYQIPESTWLVDSRPAGGGSGGSGGSGGTTPSTFAMIGGAPRDNAALASELDSILSRTEARRDLVTTNANRFCDLVFETRITLSNVRRGPNCQAISAQVLQGGTTAVSAPRTGTEAEVQAAVNADILALADPSFYIVRVLTAATVSTDVAHVLFTVG